MASTAETPSRVGAFVARRPLTVALWLALAFALPLVLGLRHLAQRRAARVVPPIFATLPDFQLTDENGRAFGLGALRGQAFVASFFFTSCPSICPRLTAEVERLQGLTRGRALNFVSFSVDPRVDTPERLRAWATRFHADPARWHFLTGEAPRLQRVAQEGFLQATEVRDDAVPGRPQGYNILHSGNVILVDRRGQIRGYFRANAEGSAALIEALDAISRE